MDSDGDPKLGKVELESSFWIFVGILVAILIFCVGLGYVGLNLPQIAGSSKIEMGSYSVKTDSVGLGVAFLAAIVFLATIVKLIGAMTKIAQIK